MYGFNLERGIKQMLSDFGYEVIEARKLGYTSEELVEIALDHNLNESIAYMEAQGLDPLGASAKMILDHVFKVDIIVRHNNKVIALQISSSNEGDVCEWRKHLDRKVAKAQRVKTACLSIDIDDYKILHLQVSRQCDSIWNHTDKIARFVTKLLASEKWGRVVVSKMIR